MRYKNLDAHPGGNTLLMEYIYSTEGEGDFFESKFGDTRDRDWHCAGCDPSHEDAYVIGKFFSDTLCEDYLSRLVAQEPCGVPENALADSEENLGTIFLA